MTKVDIFSGFLGAGKTTLIKKLIKEAFAGEKLVLIENEFGEIGIDGGFMQDAGITVNELNSGCICCSLVGDFGEALKKVVKEYSPDRILIEPSGVGKLSDVIKAVQDVHSEELVLNSFTTVVDAKKVKIYMKNFGEFFNNQVEFANSIVMSHTGGLDEEKINTALAMLREHNSGAEIITTDWNELDGKQILAAMEHKDTLAEELRKLAEETAEEEARLHEHEHHHHHHDDDDEDEHEHHHHHHDDDDEDEHEHHHHHHDDDDDEDEHEHHHHHHDDDDEDEHEHHHHHHDDDDEDEHEHHHHHHGHHHADDVFTSWGRETAVKFTEEGLRKALAALDNAEEYGSVLRAKGIVQAQDGGWIHFDYVPGECDIRRGSASTTGRLCVIGAELKEDKLPALFGL